MPLKLIRGNKGVKDLSDRVFRSVIAPKSSEEIRDKNLGIQKPSKMHTLRKMVDSETKMQELSSENYTR